MLTSGPVIGAAIIAALVMWVRLPGQTVRNGDRAWTRDLLLAPSVAIFAALALGWPAYAPIYDSGWGDQIINEGWAQWVVGPIVFVVLLVSVIGGPVALGGKSQSERWFAYPAFALYEFWLGILVAGIRDGTFY